MSDFPPRCIIHGLPQGFTCFLYQEDRNTSAALSSYHHSCWRLPRVQAARIGRCRPCPLRDQCLGYGTATKRPRRVSAVLWPQSSSPPTNLPAVQELASCLGETHAIALAHPLLWGDWQRCQIRRRWIRLLRTQTVMLIIPFVQAKQPATPTEAMVLTRAQRAHSRLNWVQRLARLSSTPPASGHHPRTRLSRLPSSLA